METADKLRNYAENWAPHEADRALALEAAEEIERLRRENAAHEINAKAARHIFCA